MTNYTESEITISLNFSDPILVSQGVESDKLKIVISNDFFLDPKIAETQIDQSNINSRLLNRKETATETDQRLE